MWIILSHTNCFPPVVTTIPAFFISSSAKKNPKHLYTCALCMSTRILLHEWKKNLFSTQPFVITTIIYTVELVQSDIWVFPTSCDIRHKFMVPKYFC
jgi:hypothetical protein